MTGWQWHQLDHMQIICTSLQTDNHASTSVLSFYRPNALPATQPTASKHWRQMWLFRNWCESKQAASANDRATTGWGTNAVQRYFVCTGVLPC